MYIYNSNLIEIKQTILFIHRHPVYYDILTNTVSYTQ